MIINWDGKAYDFGWENLTIHQAEVIEMVTRQPIAKWLDAIGKGSSDLTTVKVTYWLMLAQNGEEIPFDTVDFPLLKFGAAFGEASAAGRQEAVPEPPDPTRASRSRRASPSPPDPPTPGNSHTTREDASLTGL